MKQPPHTYNYKGLNISNNLLMRLNRVKNTTCPRCIVDIHVQSVKDKLWKLIL